MYAFISSTPLHTCLFVLVSQRLRHTWVMLSRRGASCPISFPVLQRKYIRSFAVTCGGKVMTIQRLLGWRQQTSVVHFKGHFAQSWLSQLTGTVSIFFLIFSVLIKYVKVHLEFVLSELLCCREYIQTSGTFQAHVLAWLESSCSLNYAT